ncbi:cytochrome C oxidase subunit IV family protein [Mycolicibacterium palauense]|uniref:cytochrome C oxidase subunit IV family protein n=1 Tax=Mycolicibacterium palauense TaxID=2034511 RepID=UPI000BFEEA80|nr:cytochrome C oxidase subunit IV family protein [Mycolicibacterium palauense]
MTATAPAPARAARATTVAWVVLSAITILSWWLAPGHAGAAGPSVPITVAVVLLALVKGRMVIRYFMEVRTAPRWLKLATDGWLVVLWGAVLAIYLY